ncbi:MAG: hypothetical protein HKN93_06385 [Acidimicrobiia bacterium]|nr:hypothetical protein [Acidimicrobiia bacterium]
MKRVLIVLLVAALAMVFMAPVASAKHHGPNVDICHFAGHHGDAAITDAYTAEMCEDYGGKVLNVRRVGAEKGHGVDTTAPTLDEVSLADGDVTCALGMDLVWTVDAFDNSDLFELEVDNSLEPDVPQFTVYADTENPYGDDEAKAAWEAAGATVTYNAGTQTWVIGFGCDFSDFFRSQGGITFYIEVVDEFGNQFGDMFDVTPDMTFAYVL